MQYGLFSRYVHLMKIFRFFLLMGVGCLAAGVWARSPADADASSAQRLSEQRRAELRAALKASRGQEVIGSEALRQEALDSGRTLSDEERAQRRQQMRQQLREIRYESP